MTFTLIGLASLGFAPSYDIILVSVACIGIGSAIFHPEATRLARQASGGRQGLAQGVFQVGGQAGGALGPLFAAFVIVPHGQASLAWFTLAALLAMALMVWTAGQHALIRRHIASMRASLAGNSANSRHSSATVMTGMIVLTLLMVSKVAYVESFRRSTPST
jgi:FSR family fosmidomycin resistance protein-like MFS transporter